MGQIWAALKSLGIIAELIRELIQWCRDYKQRREREKADETHDKNAADIDRAFDSSVPASPTGESRPAPPESPPVPGGQSGGS